MKRTSLLIIALAILPALLLSMNSLATLWTVDVKNFEFSPEDLDNVMVGDTVMWIWEEGSHTTTSSEIPTGAASWDQPITSSATSFSYVPSVPGTYNYVCTPHAALGMVGSFVVSTVSGIAGNSSLPEVTIAPNPFTDRVSIGFGSKNNADIQQLQIYDLTGELTFSTAIDKSAGEAVISIDLQGIDRGLYFFKFTGELGEVYTERVIKQ